MATSVTMTYGSYSFSPVPSYTYSTSMERTPGTNICLSTPVEIQLEGVIFPTGTYGFGPVTSGINELIDLFKCTGCQDFVIQCDGTDVINGPAKVMSFNVNPRTDSDLYVNTAAYSVTLQMVNITGDAYHNQPSGISAISEEWSVDFLDERIGGTVSTQNVFNTEARNVSVQEAFTITHSISVSAPYCCKSSGPDVTGWQQAVDYVRNELAVSTPETGSFGLFAVPANLGYFNHFRTFNKNVHDGSISVNDTWTACESGALEDFDVNLEDNIDSYLKTVTVNGTIQGLATIGYDTAATGIPKIDKAFDYWKAISGDIYSRAATIYNGNIASDGGNMSLNLNPLNYSIGYNTNGGTVTYNYTFNDRPYNCVPTAKSEIINITEGNPNDVFSNITILGRAAGPLYQDINTIGQRTREISIEAILPPDTGCLVGGFYNVGAPTGYDAFVSGYESALSAAYAQVFINSENKTWTPKEGRFTFNKSWTVGGCS
jgi:hypothetical protein